MNIPEINKTRERTREGIDKAVEKIGCFIIATLPVGVGATLLIGKVGKVLEESGITAGKPLSELGENFGAPLAIIIFVGGAFAGVHYLVGEDVSQNRKE